jgi:adenylyl-sulfate kinase
MITDALMNIFRKDPTVKRHLAKTVSWRLVGSVDTMLLGWLITGHIATGAKIGGMELLTKMLLYFFHERMWHKIKFGLPTKYATAQQVKKDNAANLFASKSNVSREEREQLSGNKAFTIWLTGLSASGKSTIASELDSWFYSNGMRAYVVDGDNTRMGINSDLSFSAEDRSENIRRVAEMCKLFNESGTIVIASFISPFEADRAKAKQIIGADSFIEVFADASIETCKARDVKGLYALAESGKIKDFTGVDSPYERPAAPDVHLRTDIANSQTCTGVIIDFMIREKYTIIDQVLNS